jgi:hypothetical protein
MDVDKFRESGRKAEDICEMICQFSRAEIYKVVFQIQTEETWREGRNLLNGKDTCP